MLWVALHFPALSLEVFPASSEPFAVIEGSVVRIGNEAAGACGIRPGMPFPAAQALASDLVARVRDEDAERQTLTGLASWAGRFTPAVSLQHCGLLLEIGGCLRLYRGLENLLQEIREGLREMGYRFNAACAPTPHAAWLLALAGGEKIVTGTDQLEKNLGGLSVKLLDQPPKTRESLEMVGAHTLKDCLKLPRQGMARRFGQALLDEIDRALGRLPDARKYYVPPPSYERRLELPGKVQEAEALLFALHRILPELAGHLSLLQAGIQEVELVCRHEDFRDTVLKLGFAKPTRSLEKMRLLFREVLLKTILPSPVHAICLNARNILPLAAFNPDFFSEDEGEDSLLLERLRIRLGNDAVFGLEQVADHRPEKAWRYCEAGKGKGSSGNPNRPVWLLQRPLRCREGSLALKSGPERIESGWWDGMDVARDYYVAQHRNGARLWVYCDRSNGEWYVQGLFA